MTLTELLREFRVRADDLKVPYLWEDEDVTRWINESQSQACRRSALILDSKDPEITQLSVSANDPDVALDDRVVAIRRARESGHETPLALLTTQEMDEQRPGWEDHTSTELEALVVDANTGAVRCYPTVTAATTVLLTVQRVPLADMEAPDDEPEVSAAYHMDLIDWVLHRAFGVDDVDAGGGRRGDAAKSKEYLQKFVENFGEITPRLESFFKNFGLHNWASRR